MLIAFEGPDEVGKSTSAKAVSALSGNEPIYNMTLQNYREAREALKDSPEVVQAWDRVDWLTHMVYRLAMPDKDWNDDRPRTVFAAPDVHLVFKIHGSTIGVEAEDEGYVARQLAAVNDDYFQWANYLMALNAMKNYALFRSISIFRVIQSEDEGFRQTLVDFDSPAFDFDSVADRYVRTDEDLLALLRYDEQHRF